MADFISVAIQTSGAIFEADRDQKIQDRLAKILRTEAELIADKSKAAAPQFSGALRRSIEAKSSVSGSQVNVSVVAGETYAHTITVGRKPAFIPIQPLILWFQSKIGLEESEAAGAAILLSRKRSKSSPKRRKILKTAGSRKRVMAAIKDQGVLPE